MFSSPAWSQQQMSSFDRDRAQTVLQVIASEIKKHYYDTHFHGIDWDARVILAKQQIQQANSFNMAMSHIAAALDSLNDSHTFLLPPQHAYRLDYGVQYQMVGERCFITRVRPRSDAEAKGAKAGDEVLSINGFNVSRENLWKMDYVFSILRPQPDLRFVLRDLSGTSRQVDIVSKVRREKLVKDLTGSDTGNDIWDLIRDDEIQERLTRPRFSEYGEQLLVLKVPEFFFSTEEVGSMLSKARRHQNLIVDLRGNPGGGVEALKLMIGAIFDKEVKMADRIGRKETKPEVSKPVRNPFSGRLVVLVDARSASAAELFARIVQLEKRGVVLGDVTSGSVMEAKHYDEKLGDDRVIFYGASVTEWDLVMADGKSLEHVGVVPNEVVLPTAQDISSGRDPVLVRAAEILGVKISAEDAGKAFPYEWAPE